MIIGITGSIGSGKTTAAKIFGKHHYIRIDADEVGHKIIKKNSTAYRKITDEFGNCVLGKNKGINRNRLGNLAFSGVDRLRKLNSITHPGIIGEIKKQAEKIKGKCGAEANIIIDAPLLLETETKNLVDKVIVIKCSTENVLKRNRRYSKEKIERILKLQMPIKEKLKYADFVIDNSKDLRHLEMQVKKIVLALNER